MSDAISSYVRGHSANPPSRLLSSYSPTPYQSNTPESRRFSAELGNIDRLFKQVAIGDIIMSPAKGYYEPFLIGEITSDWSKADDFAVPKLLGEEVPTRRVRWLNVALSRRDFAPRTARRLINRHAITEVDDSLYRDILDTVYPSYSWGERSKLDLFGNAYSGKDPLQPFEAAKLLKYVMSSVFAFEREELDSFQELELDAAIDTYFDESLVEELAQNFNSPGKFTLIAGSGLVSVLVAAGLMIATADPNASFQQHKTNVEAQIDKVMVANGTANAGAKANAKIAVGNYLNSLEGSTWKPVQKGLGRSAQQTLGLSLNNSVEVARHRAELNAK